MVTAIGVIGESLTNERRYELARAVGREIARRGAVLVGGGLGGVMEASCRGAKEAGGTTVGILPGPSRHEANPWVDIPIVTGMGQARNVIVVRSSDAIVAVGGSWGTLSEIAFALKMGVPVVGVETWEISDDITKAQTAEEAVAIAVGLASGGGGDR